MPWGASIDMYRKVPTDLLEGTRRGNFFSILATVAMLTLFLFETREFMKNEVISDLKLDKSDTDQIRLWFNITMMDLPCDHAVIDVFSVLGTEQNVTAHVHKTTLDADGVKKLYLGRNKEQNDIVMYDEAVTDEYYDDSDEAMELDPDDFEDVLEQHHFVFVDFFASWCSHCQLMAPTWEVLAELMNTVAFETTEEHKRHHEKEDDDEIDDDLAAHDFAMEMREPILIAKVDCVEHEELCNENKITSYPTLRLYHSGKLYGEYMGDRTVLEFTHYLATVETEILKKEGNIYSEGHGMHMDKADMEAQKKMNVPKDRWHRPRVMKKEWHDEDHPGCHINGVLMVDRVPGNFQILAKSKKKTLIPSMTNVSHEVHNLTFGMPTTLFRIRNNEAAIHSDVVKNLDPMQGNVYVSQLHEAYHHHMKLVSTNFKYNFGSTDYEIYQILSQSQLAQLPPAEIPGAQFSYDLSPVAVTYRKTYRKWYDYLTSIMAIVGGTFTLVGIFESSVHAVTSKKKR